MNNMPIKLRRDCASDTFYKRCARAGLHGHACAGRITFEHAIIVAGKQVQAKWAVIPLCEKAHNCGRFQDCGDFNKHINEWIALSRATIDELRAISKAFDYVRYLNYLNEKYGVFLEFKTYWNGETGINYGALERWDNHRGEDEIWG